MTYKSVFKQKKKKKIKEKNGPMDKVLNGGSTEENKEADWESVDSGDDDSSSQEDSEDESSSGLFGMFKSRNAGPSKISDKQLFEKYPLRNIKQILVVRDDLKMGKGKIGAQCGHATLGSFKSATKLSKNSKYWTKTLEKWSWEGQKKVCVKVPTEADLINVQKMANELGIPSYLVADAGLTQIKSGSLTVCGLGPADSAHIDLITGDKKLL